MKDASSNGSRKRVLVLVLVGLVLLLPVGGVLARPAAKRAQAFLLALPHWDFIAPADWTGRPSTIETSVTDRDGLDPATSQYRYSTDGAATWSDWLADGSLETGQSVSDTVFLTLTISSLIDSATDNVVQFRVTDTLMYGTFSPTYTIKVDGTAPGSPIGLSADPSGWTTVNDFTLTWSNPGDTSGVTRAYYKFGSAPTHGEDYVGFRTAADINQISGLSVPSAGETPCYVWLEDTTGNADYASATSTTLYYSGGDAPGAPFAMSISPDGWTATNDFDVNWTNPPAPAGIRAAWYKWDSVPAHSEDGTRVAGEGINSLEGLTTPREGATSLYVWLEDGAGSKDHGNRSQVEARYDVTAPETTYTFTPPLPSTGWFSDTVIVDLVPSDAHAEIKETKWRREGGLWKVGDSITANSYASYDYYSVDNADNVEATKTLTVPIDTQAPNSMFTVSPPAPASGWYTDTVSVIISATDDLSGWEEDTWYRVDGGSWQEGTEALISSNGSHSFAYYSRDVAGNAENAQTVAEVCKIDKEPPTVTATPDKAGDYVQPPVVITLGVEDALSGPDGIAYRRQEDTEWTPGDTITIDGSQGDGTYTYVYRGEDVAGNAITGSISINLDGTPPSQPTGLVADPSGWVSGDDFDLEWANPEDFSGVGGVYYQIDTDPAVTRLPAPGYVVGDDIESLQDIIVGEEGAHTVYVWLEDKAGNEDEFNRAMLEDAFKRDSSPPVSDEPLIEGAQGCGKYYTESVTITLRGHDDVSDVESYSYIVNGGASIVLPAASPSFVVNGDGRHIVDYWATDLAGNREVEGNTTTVYIDATAPGSPGGLEVTPSGWSNANDFSASWTKPWDYAGINAAHYKVGAAPTGPDDGQRVEKEGIFNLSGLSVTGEGVTPLYVWLEDSACNVDHTTATSVLLKYDATSPETTVLPAREPMPSGWYTAPVSVDIDAQDGASGVMESLYKVNAGGWQQWPGEDVVLDEEGSYTICVRSRDRAGNVENENCAEFKLDFHPPNVDVQVSSTYATGDCIDVSWPGEDTSKGSGIGEYVVQYKQGGCGPWQLWDRANPEAAEGTFCGMSRNNFYYFRAKATDRAGWTSAWSSSGLNGHVYRDGVANGDFEVGALPPWNAQGDLGADTVYDTGHDGSNSHMARISKGEWEYPDPRECSAPVTGVPVGYGQILQPLSTLPRVDCDSALTLSFRYRILSYDIMWGALVPDGEKVWIDTFEVYVCDIYGNELQHILRDGNDTPGSEWQRCNLYDMGWRYFTYDMSEWAGEAVSIKFKILNRHDDDWPTWVHVDDVRLSPAMPDWPYRLHLPVVAQRTSPYGGAALLEKREPHVSSRPQPGRAQDVDLSQRY